MIEGTLTKLTYNVLDRNQVPAAKQGMDTRGVLSLDILDQNFCYLYIHQYNTPFLCTRVGVLGM